MKKILLLLALSVSINPVFATYPTIDIKSITETIKQLKEATKQTKILDQQTTLMIEELSVAWSTYDNAMNMYDSLGNATKLTSYVTNHPVLRGFQQDWDRLGKWTSTGDPRMIGAASGILDRVVKTGKRYDSAQDLANELKTAEASVTKRRFLQNVVRTAGETDAQAQVKVDKMTKQEVASAIVDDSWNAQAEIANEVNNMRKVNNDKKVVLTDAVNKKPETLLEVMNDVKLAVIQNTDAVIDNADTQNQVLAAQTHAINVNNELLKQQLEIEARTQSVKEVLKDVSY